MKKRLFTAMAALFASLALIVGLVACGSTKYKITFTDEAGTEITSVTVEKGEFPEFTGETPKKAAEEHYTYTFAGWSDGTTTYAPGQLPAAEKDVTYKAAFTQVPKSYTVTWHVENDTSTSSVKYGEKAVYNGTPEKAASVSTVYTFAGWAKTAGGDALTDEELTVSGDVDLYAVFTESVRKYTVKFVDENGTTELLTAQVDYNTNPVYTGTAPTKAGDAQYSYTFSGWEFDGVTYGPSENLPKVSGAMTFKAKYTQSVNKYTVTWSIDGTTSETEYDYGATPAYTGTPEKADTEDYSYEFDGWASSEDGTKLETLPAVTGDVTYYARFNQVDRKFTVTWHIGEETKTTRVTKNTAPTWTEEEPAKQQDAQYTYTFKGWATSAGSEDTVELSEQTITQATDYYAVFNKATREYTITFIVDGQDPYTAQVEYGVRPAYKEDAPAKDQTVSTVYTFKGWTDGETEEEYTKDTLPTVTGEATYTAVFTESARPYTITIKYYKGLQGTDTIKQESTFTLGYGTIIDETNTTKIEAFDDGTHYLPDMFRIGGIVTGDKEYVVRYTEADTWDGTSKSESLSGTGNSAEDPFLIKSAADLYYLADAALNKNYGSGQYYKLTKSIDLANHEWTPICYANGTMTWTYFEGNFDGGGYTIAGLHCNKTGKHGIGLFGSVRNGEIKDLTVQSTLASNTRAGGLAYVVNNETVSNIKTFVNITLNEVASEVYSGGIFGTTTAGTSTFTNLESYGTIDSTGKRIGGIIGNTGSGTTVNITDCTNYSNITLATHAGGMIGQAEGKVVLSGCVNYGNMTATTERAGGIIATQQKDAGSTITNCTNYGKISAPNAASDKLDATGGIIGIAKNSTVTGCVNYGEVSGIQHTGGIIGETVTVTVTECTNHGAVKGEMTVNERNKGFAGIVGWTTNSSHVTKCTNNGNVEGNTNTGGICGYLGKGSTCPVEDEDANTNTGKVTGNSAYHDFIGFDGNA